ncbi:serine hydrolase domain-containing protein [Sphaerisporangium krabiense]|uniref:serine hydrolase domain-containing protein n=1 Tax=Sphaerisporangium krabiense TaxID=763782 RepID=UPI0016103C54|nr:serine hydrolase domain-containing protein [Sphaerisporangium krabiense]
MAIHGTCDPRYAEVHEEFERNFEERGEIGASVCVTIDGDTVVDLWGGTADPTTGTEWKQDTIGHVWSCTKGATALCAHVLASRGELDVNAPVVKYWPEFGAKGKEGVLVRHLLTHTAGLPALRAPLPEGALYDAAAMAERLAGEEPFWEPGTRQGYHALTFGFLVGEVVRRVSGRGLGTFFRDEIAGPLGLDFWIGLPEEFERRVAPTVPAPPPAPGASLPTFYQRAFTDPASLQALVIGNTGGYVLTPGESDSRAAHAAEIGAVGGITNGRGLAGMYRPLAVGGGLVSPDQLAMMGSVAAATQVDAALLVPTRWTLGFMKGSDNRHLPGPDGEGVLLSEDAFGHSGMGGSLGFADPVPRLSFGYSMNLQGSGLGVNERGQSLVNAVYRTLGYQQAHGGLWYL